MKILIWKEWREQRLFFFLAVGIIILTRIAPMLIPERILDYELYSLTMCYIILPILFSLFLGSSSFTNEFTKNTKSFLLSHPVSTARLFWIKYFSGLVLLILLVLLSHIILFIPFPHLIKTGISPVTLKQQLLAGAYLFSSIITIYSAACFSSLLLKNSLPAIICTPFLLLFGILLVIPLAIFLFFISPNSYIFTFLVLATLIAVFLIFSFLAWQRAIVRDMPGRKILFITTLVILFISFGCHAAANLAAGIKLNQTIQQVETAGIKFEPEEVIPPMIPDKDNAALVYQQAFNLADNLKNKYKEEWQYMPYESKIPLEELTTKQKSTISRIIKDTEFVKLYALIEQAVNMTACRFDIKYEEGVSMLLPHLSKMRSMARLIATRTYILSEEKRYNDALQSAEIGLRLGDFLTDEPLIISQLVHIAVDDIAVKSLNLFINRENVTLSDKDYRRLISIIEGKNGDVIKAFEGELALFGGYIFRQKMSLGLVLRDSVGHRILGSFYGSYLGRPILKSDYAFYIQAFRKLIDYSQKPYFSIKEKANEWDRELSTDRYTMMKHIISSMILPALSRVLEQQTNHSARLDTFKLALALKIYREKHGHYPDTLSPLAPEIIPELPLDPFTGKNYIYRKEGKGFIVYSVGPNEKDDGGVYDPKQSPKYDDIAFKITN